MTAPPYPSPVFETFVGSQWEDPNISRTADRSDSQIMLIPRPALRLPGLAMIGRWRSRRSMLWPLHTHSYLEIHHLSEGLLSWRAGGQTLEVSGGTTFVAGAGEPHGSPYAVLSPGILYWIGIHVWPGGCRRGHYLLDLAPRDATKLARGLAELSGRHLATSLTPLFETIFDYHETPRAFGPTRIRNTIQELFFTLLDAPRAPARERSTVVREALRLMDATLDTPLRLSDLSRRLGWSPSHLQQRFRQEMGVSAGEYHAHTRLLAAAKHLENTEDSITSIALRFGFPSSQYFATVFKRAMRMTPHEFRRTSRRYRTSGPPAPVRV